MNQAFTHPWPSDEVSATNLQCELAKLVECADRLGEIRTIAGVDVAYDKFSSKLVAAVVVLDAQNLNVVARASAEDVERFPYLPGLFSFRELPSIAAALRKLDITPDLIVCDGQGVAHPRRFGLACHLGILFDIPTIGCGKSRLIGNEETTGVARGESSPLRDGDEIIGIALRTQNGIKPVYVSVGHRISLETECDWILRLSAHFRLPETTRQADQ